MTLSVREGCTKGVRMDPLIRVEPPDGMPARGTTPSVPIDEAYLIEALRRAKTAAKAARAALAGRYETSKALFTVAVSSAQVLALLSGWLDEASDGGDVQ